MKDVLNSVVAIFAIAFSYLLTLVIMISPDGRRQIWISFSFWVALAKTHFAQRREMKRTEKLKTEPPRLKYHLFVLRSGQYWQEEIYVPLDSMTLAEALEEAVTVFHKELPRWKKFHDNYEFKIIGVGTRLFKEQDKPYFSASSEGGSLKIGKSG